MEFAARWISSNRALDEMMEAAEASASKNTIDLALGDPDLDTDPRIVEAAFEDARRGYTHYAPARGDSDLLDAIRTSWKEDYQVSVSEHELMVTASGCHALWLLLSAVLDPQDEVIIFSPFFSPYPEQIRLAGGIPVEVATSPAKGFAPDPQTFEAAITPKTKAVIVNSPGNPTGRILSSPEIEALLHVCLNHNILYIADDIYTAYDFARPFVAAASLPQASGNIATIHSFSKDFCMSGWRLGYVVAPSDVVSAMLTVNESNVYVAPTISQRAAFHALKIRKEIYRQIHHTYKKRMDYVAERVSSIPSLALPCCQGGLYAFIDITRSGETSSSFTRKLLKKHDISVIPGTAFGGAGEGFVRMALRQDEATLKKVFDALEQDDEWSRSC